MWRGLLKKGLYRVPGSSPHGAAIIGPAIDWGERDAAGFFNKPVEAPMTLTILNAHKGKNVTITVPTGR
jgi:hypothetical protein